MDIVGIVVALVIGAIAGWLAGVIVEGGGFGLLVNMLLGIVGAFIAALLFPRLGLGLTLGGGVVGRDRRLHARRRGAAADRQLDPAPGLGRTPQARRLNCKIAGKQRWPLRPALTG